MGAETPSILRPPVLWNEAPAPPHAALPGFRTGDEFVELDLPGSGAITVTVDTIVVHGPDESKRQQVLAQLGSWALGQQLRALGFTVINGSCITRNGRSIILTGPPRVGSSLLALVLIERGWSLTSDGIVAWDADEVPLVLSEEVTVDRSVIIGLDPARIIPAMSERDRVRVLCPSIGSGELAGAVLLGRRAAIGAPQVIYNENANPLAERLSTTPIPALIRGRANRPHHVPAVPGLRVLRPLNGDEQVLRSSTPPVLAGLIESQLLELCS